MSFLSFTQGKQVISSMPDVNNRRFLSCVTLESLVQGANRFKYFNQPLKSNLKKQDEVLFNYDGADDGKSEYFDASSPEHEDVPQYVTAGTQTDFRESEAQTYPWDPPFTVRQVHKEPEVLLIKKFSLDNGGLPATMLEVKTINKTRDITKLKADLGNSGDDKSFAKKRELIRDEVKIEWDYKLSRLNQKQNEKMRLMQGALCQELTKLSQRNGRLLKNIWTRNKNQSSRYHLKMQDKLRKEINDLERVETIVEEIEERKFHMGGTHSEKVIFSKHIPHGKQKLEEQVEELFTSYYLTDITGLAEFEKWLEEEQSIILKNEITLPKRTGPVSHMQRLTEKAYNDLLVIKRTKLPPKVYHEDYDREETPLPTVASYQGFERVDLAVEVHDPVTILQKTLRGRAYQKEVLEVIDRHKAGLSILFSQQKSENNISSSQTQTPEDNDAGQ